MSLYLRQIALRNFRTFGHLKLDLPPVPGLLIVSGQNGLGKSSLFDAIEWCLTGKIKHFERFVRKSDTEADYLSREGTERFSHQAIVSFDSGSSITRQGHESNGPIGTSLEAVRELLVSSEWGERVVDVATYLGLTHFLGQASHQRFLSRDPVDQWKALRVPTGVERLEQIRFRLRGKGAQIAFNRKTDNLTEELSRCRDRLAEWDGLVQRLRKLEATAFAAGILSREDIYQRARELKARLAGPSTSQIIDGPTSELGELLAAIREELLTARRRLEERQGLLNGVEKLPIWYAERLAVLDAVEKERATVAAERDELAARRSILATSVQDAERMASGQRDRVQRSKERVSLLTSAQEDSIDLVAAEARIQAANELIKSAEGAAAETRTSIEIHEAGAAELRGLRVEVADAERSGIFAGSLADEHATLKQLTASKESSLRDLDNARKISESVGDAVQAEIQLRSTRAVLKTLETEAATQRARSGAIATAVATIAAHLSVEDHDCPVCQTAFASGALQQLARESAAKADAALLVTSTEVERVQRDVLAAELRLEHARATESVLKKATDEFNQADRELSTARSRLATKLGVPESEDFEAVVEKRLAMASTDLGSRRGALAERMSQLGNPEAALEILVSTRARTDSQLANAKEAHARAQQEHSAIERRLVARLGTESIRHEDISLVLQTVEAERTQLEAGLATAVRTLEAAVAALKAHADRESSVAVELSRLEATRAQSKLQNDLYSNQWLSLGLAAPPSTHAFLRAVSEVEANLIALHGSDDQLKKLVSAFEALSRSEELEDVKRSVDRATQGVAIDSYREELESAVANAAEELLLAQRAHDAVERLADRLQSEADKFSDSVLRPLNGLIGAFNDAFLTAPGTSVAFNADYFKDRTGFNMQLRKRPGPGLPDVAKNLNPQLLLSEGQLAANGFSILCSASVSYQWSKWRALLLDDPLQHNDVIHVAAFADLMRNLVAQEKYQVVMSSHDRGETDFLERKFTAASLPCVVLQLIGDSPNGVTYAVKANAYARDAQGGLSQEVAG